MTSTPLDLLHGLTEIATDRVSRILLASSIEPGDSAVGRLVRTLGAADTLRLLLGDAATAPGLDAEALAQLRAHVLPALTVPRIDEVRGTIEELDLAVLVPRDDAWPERLKDLGDAAPLCLFARGNTDLLTEHSLTGITGSRAATGYGTSVATEIAVELAERGHVILTGGAYGIDAAANRGGLSADGYTVAVLPGGLDRPYPSGNRELFQQVVHAGGLVLSESAPGSLPTKWRLMRRSRLIAALAHRVVIVEAGVRSGSLRLADQANELNRPVGAVPGPITSVTSTGCNLLIRAREAVAITTANDVHMLLPGQTPTTGSGDFPHLDSLVALTADWEDDPTLTHDDRTLLQKVPSAQVQRVLTRNARAVEQVFLGLLDGVRAAATRELLDQYRTDPAE